MNPVLVSLVGNDPAPVALAVKVALGQLGGELGPEVVLVRDGPQGDPLRAQRVQALEAWLSYRGLAVRWVEGQELEHLKAPALVNLTAGDKMALYRLYRLAEGKGWRALIVEAHGPRAVVAFAGGGVRDLHPHEQLNLQDYEILYLRPAGARLRGQEKEVPPHLRGVAWHRVEVALGDACLFALQGNRPLLYKPFGGGSFKDHVNALAQLAKDLGGQLAVPITDFPARSLLGVHPNNRETVRRTFLQQAKEARVRLLHPEEGATLLRLLGELGKDPGGGRTPLPFPLPKHGPVLLALLGEQPVPLLGSYLAHRPREVYLVTTESLEKDLGRLAHAQSVLEGLGARVHVRTVGGPFALEEVRVLFAPVAKAAEARNLPLVVNWNGGTKLMALGLLQALPPGARVEYLRGSRLEALSGPTPRPVPWGEVSPRQVLGLYGYRLEPHPELGQIVPDPGVLARAEALLRSPKDPKAAEAFLEVWIARFGADRHNLQRRGANALGLALEYYVYVHLYRFFAPRAGRVLPGGRLVPIGEALNNPREVDGLLWHKGRMVWVECKPSLTQALKEHREDAALHVLKENFGGLFGGGILVGRQGAWKAHENPPMRLREALKDPRLKVFSLEGRFPFPEGTVWRFPQDLGEAFVEWL